MSDTLTVGTLVKISNWNSGLVGMSGTIAAINDGMAEVMLTSWGRIARFPLADLTPVERTAAA